MLSRHPRTTERPKSLPAEWMDKFQKVLEEQYASDLSHTNRKFDLFTELYPNEVCLGLCLNSSKMPSSLPTTYIISADLSEKTEPLELVDRLVDSAEIFFDQFFANEDEVEYTVVWQEGELRGLKFFYMISRENLRLSQEASDLLGDDFPI